MFKSEETLTLPISCIIEHPDFRGFSGKRFFVFSSKHFIVLKCISRIRLGDCTSLSRRLLARMSAECSGTFGAEGTFVLSFSGNVLQAASKSSTVGIASAVKNFLNLIAACRASLNFWYVNINPLVIISL